MYYHTIILHLFRPFLKVDLTNSRISPREICTSCANNIASLLSTYRQTYGLRRAPLLVSHSILTSATIHLLNLPASSSALSLSITFLRGMVTNHPFSKRAIEIIMALAKQWNIVLPAEVLQAAYEIPSEQTINAQDKTQSSYRIESHPSSVRDDAQQQKQFHGKALAGEMPFAATKNSPRSISTPADLFWSPFPDQSLPLQAHNNGGPMDIAALLDAPNNDWDQLNRDGFKFASTNDSNLGSSGYNFVDDRWTQV